MDWWEEFLGQSLFLATAAPGVVEMSLTPPISAGNIRLNSDFDLGNGIRIRSVSVDELDDQQVQIIIYWEALQPITEDYSVAVHLVAQDPPQSELDLLDQADNAHPVAGFYPTTRWQVGEIVRDDYLINIPTESQPAAIRLGMYRTDPDEGFVNTPWLSLPLPKST